MLFYIKAKLSIQVEGISGVSQEGVSHLVESMTRSDAKLKFEGHCRKTFANMGFKQMTFEYLEIATPII